MNVSEQDIALVVEKIKAEVNKALAKQPTEENDTVDGTAVLVCAHVVNAAKALAALNQRFDGHKSVYLLNGAKLNCPSCSVKPVSTDDEKNAAMDEIALSQNVVLLAPPIGVLKSLSQGEDNGFIENAVLKSILWGRAVHVILDFEPPKFRRGTFFENLVNAIDALTAMDVGVSTYRVAKDGGEGKLALVTETDILDAHNSGEKTVFVTSDAIVTPLAKDKANELKIYISKV